MREIMGHLERLTGAVRFMQTRNYAQPCMANCHADDGLRDGRNDGRYNGNAGAKLTPFTGKESWKVWFGSFEDVATMCGWNDEDRLKELQAKL